MRPAVVTEAISERWEACGRAASPCLARPRSSAQVEELRMSMQLEIYLYNTPTAGRAVRAPASGEVSIYVCG